jgi:Protein of unknown function (DUF1579)
MTETKELTHPEIGEAHRRLEVFVGKWHTEGTSFAEGQTPDDPRSSGVQWTSDEHYDWLPGGFFLLHQWDALAGARVFKGTEIIGFDEANGGYFSRFFDNAGFHPEYTATVDGDVWKFTEPSTRATLTVSEDQQHIEHVWEWRQGGAWLPLCERRGARL